MRSANWIPMLPAEPEQMRVAFTDPQGPAHRGYLYTPAFQDFPSINQYPPEVLPTNWVWTPEDLTGRDMGTITDLDTGFSYTLTGNRLKFDTVEATLEGGTWQATVLTIESAEGRTRVCIDLRPFKITRSDGEECIMEAATLFTQTAPIS